MEVKCEYCGSLIPDDAPVCPNCGATNVNLNRSADDTPKTIEELKKWYQDRGLPPYEETRFFIGIDCKEPKAFGIYEDHGTFIVYKNKSDGSRAIRYKGTDQDYAVNELYLKLKSEILNQREKQAGRPRQSRQQKTKSTSKDNGTSGGIIIKAIGIIAGIMLSVIMFHVAVESEAGIVIGAFVAMLLLSFVFRKIFRNHQGKVILIFAAIFVAFLLLVVLSKITGHTPHYYDYNDTAYVWYNDTYYYYDPDIDDYTMLDDEDVPPDLYTSPGTYQTSVSDYDDYDGYNSDSTYIPDFTTSDDYSSWIDTIDFDSSYDYDYDWDSDYDWDTDWSDWDSDW